MTSAIPMAAYGGTADASDGADDGHANLVAQQLVRCGASRSPEVCGTAPMQQFTAGGTDMR